MMRCNLGFREESRLYIGMDHGPPRLPASSGEILHTSVGVGDYQILSALGLAYTECGLPAD